MTGVTLEFPDVIVFPNGNKIANMNGKEVSIDFVFFLAVNGLCIVLQIPREVAIVGIKSRRRVPWDWL